MTFLQPFILWGLPLVLLPVVIHLLNRLRHRPMPWAAMMFLRSATRKSTRYARLRQLLVLLMRVLAVLALVLALSRPFAGGWMGWLAASAPDRILILLDRSASMEAAASGGANSKRAHAVQLFARSAKPLAQASRLVLLENVSLDPQEIQPAAALLDHPRTRQTDTAADLPSLLNAARDWIERNRPGSVELWIASDLQRSNWLPESDRWPAVISSLGALPQTVRVRLLGLNRPWEGNASITAEAIHRQPPNAQAELEVSLEIRRSETHAATLPVMLTVDGVSSQVDLEMEGAALRYRHRVPLETSTQGGWGKVTLPADIYPGDNESYFVYGPTPMQRAAVVAEDDFVGQVLQLAAAPNPQRTNQTCDRILPANVSVVDWGSYGLVLWQGPLPPGDQVRRMESYVEEGGVLFLFPSGQPDTWNGVGWGEMQETTGETRFEIGQWEEEAGPLASTEEGLRLPLQDLQIQRRQPLIGEGRALAWFEDQSPLLTRRTIGRGRIYASAVLPHPDWSRIHDGGVLLPLLQRLLEEGAQRFSQAKVIPCGEPLPDPETGYWSAVDPTDADPRRLRAGVFRSGQRWLALERPLREDEPERLSAPEVETLLGDLSMQMFEENQGGPATLQSELWRAFLVVMLLLLLGEALLILPERSGATRPPGPPLPSRVLELATTPDADAGRPLQASQELRKNKRGSR